MRGARSVLSLGLAALLVVPAAAVAAPGQGEPEPDRPAVGAVAAGVLPRHGARPSPPPAPAGAAGGYKRLVAESRKREASIEHARQRIERDLVHLERARTLILRGARGDGEKDAPDPVLDEARRIRLRLRLAAAGSRHLLREALSAARQSLGPLERPRRAGAGVWPRFEQERDTVGTARKSPPADVPGAGAFAGTASPLAAEAEVAGATRRIEAAAQQFHHSAAAEKRAIAVLARRTARAAQQLLERARGEPPGSAAARDGSVDARRALIRLRQMEATRRQSLQHQGEQDARRIQQRQSDLAALEKRLAGLKAEVERLKRGQNAASEP
ncbi:MAG: hypothetical protein JXQ29_10775 [Planctomycetes bacterium]|nr:hypothetical protein [Planctomycetota bacterium]